MASSVSLPRALIIYGVTVPLALLLGFLLTSPDDYQSIMTVAAVMFVLCIPLMMHSHQSLLIFAWNAAIVMPFLPGRPQLWMPVALLSLGFSVVHRVLTRESRFINVPAVTWTLLVLLAVVIGTAKIRGGVGLRALGSSTYGGKGYFHIILAIVGYFALSSVRIPPAKGRRAVALYFLSGTTSIIGHLIVFAGPAFYWLFEFFPTDAAGAQVVAEMSGMSMVRFLGVAVACSATYTYMLARYGLRGLLNFSNPLRLLLFLALVLGSTLGGFRSGLLNLMLLLFIQFMLEGLYKTKFLPIAAAAALVVTGALFAVAPRLPLPAQRALTVLPLPLDLDAGARHDATLSTEWRLEMWRYLLPELPQYWLLGKGYSVNPTDLFLVSESARRGLAESYEASALAGDYHNGPLSVYIPFGTFGLLAFVAFLVASGRALYLNHRYGDPSMQQFNTFLLTMFISRCIFFCLVYGAFNYELYSFTGIIGLSVALNGGVCRVPKAATAPAVLQPALAAS